MKDPAAGPSAVPWPPIVFAVALAVALLFTWLWPVPWISGVFADILVAIGAVMIVAAVALTVAALRTLKRSGTTLRADRGARHLVTTGPFGLTRNPIYLSNALLMIGVGLAFKVAWFVLIGVVSSFLVQKLAIEPEERHLEARFGKKFLDYRRKVRRWI
jgi:protein-S-isoprenylcysteine O-methyltransferase Ste14